MKATEITKRYHDTWNRRDADALVGCFTKRRDVSLTESCCTITNLLEERIGHIRKLFLKSQETLIKWQSCLLAWKALAKERLEGNQLVSLRRTAAAERACT
jgi:hypothetical protein